MAHDDELLARMRAVDPAADLEPAPPERVAQLLEDVMDHPTDTIEHPAAAAGVPGRRRALTWVAAAAAVAVIGGVAFAMLPREDPGAPPSATPEVTATSVSAPGAVAGKCMVPSPEVLGTAEIAVDATVTTVVDGEVTLAVQRWYAGPGTDELVVTSPPEALQALIGAPDLREGQRYLLAANGGQLMVCGFSGPADTDRSSLYTAAFGG